MTIDTERTRDAEVVTGVPMANGHRNGHRADSHRQHVILLVALAALARLARDRRFRANLITTAIGLAAGRNMAREQRANAFSRMVAWDKAQTLRYERKASGRERR